MNLIFHLLNASCTCYCSWQVGKYCIWIFVNNKIYWVISLSVSKREKVA